MGKRLTIAEVEARAATALARGNDFAALGQRVRADKQFEIASRWLDRANVLRGYGDGT